ncbi:hypothetical protein BJX70DRAFT_366184 [Aspergillus crustosus]
MACPLNAISGLVVIVVFGLLGDLLDILIVEFGIGFFLDVITMRQFAACELLHKPL